jgi:imidazolonepropionase
VWVGKRSELPRKYKSAKKINAKGRMVLPGLVDSHTHLVFAGDRSREFEMRLAGQSYQDIAKSGGGIVRTMGATRKASESELLETARERLQVFLKQGVTTVEIKTGYGLDFESEKKCLKVIDRLRREGPPTVMATLLAAHAIPPEFQGRKHEYTKIVATDWLPKLKKYCDFVDMFIDDGYFDIADAEVLLSQAQKLKIPIKLHADELKLTGGTDMACKFKALSADHLLQITQREIDLLSRSEVTATLLPTTAFFLKTTHGPARRLLSGGARVALASDFNPGTSPTQDISVVAAFGALQMGMRTEEVIAAITLNGAYALVLEKQKGALLPGYDADFIMMESESVARLFYEFGQVHRHLSVFCRGKFHGT